MKYTFMQEAFGLWSCIDDQIRTESEDNKRRNGIKGEKFRDKRENS